MPSESRAIFHKHNSQLIVISMNFRRDIDSHVPRKNDLLIFSDWANIMHWLNNQL
jgi:hypothetical protein